MFYIIGNKKQQQDGFNRFENAKELCSYVGLTPSIELWRKEKVKNCIPYDDNYRSALS